MSIFVLRIKSVFLLTLLLLLAACGRVELYSGLTEREANEMLAILAQHGISSDTIPGKENTVALQVEQAQLAQAIEILRANGYPRDTYVTIGDVFQKQGLISSPLEDRVRFIYALSQGLAETISQIDGVLTARVHVVLPDNNPLSDTTTPSSAAVFIKHRQNSDLSAHIPQIKTMVSNSIESLEYDHVSVVLFPAELPVASRVTEPMLQKVLFFQVSQASVMPLWIAIAVMALLIVAAFIMTAYLLASRSRLKTQLEKNSG